MLKESAHMAVISVMNTIAIPLRKDKYVEVMKWTGLFIVLLLCATAIFSVHQQQLQKLMAETDLLNKKTHLVSKMHDEMLLITSVQLQILHASSEQQVKLKLQYLSELISNHLINYHQLKAIADESDAELLSKFKISFDKWQVYNQDLISYANAVSDSGFINTLNKVNLTFSQLNEEENDTLLLITQLK